MNQELKLDNFTQDEIVSIEEVGNLPTVDITVDDTHMFYLENDVYTHNSGLQAEIITMQSISEAFNKCFVADFIFSVSRTLEDKQTNGGRVYIAKNRNGADGIVYSIFMDTSNIDIKIIERYDPDKISSPSLSPEEQQHQMLSKYKKLMKGAIM